MRNGLERRKRSLTLDTPQYAGELVCGCLRQRAARIPGFLQRPGTGLFPLRFGRGGAGAPMLSALKGLLCAGRTRLGLAQ